MTEQDIYNLLAGGESKARNQRMQNMLRMIGYGENLGSGFPLILSAWDEKHWLKPELIEQPELMQVKLALHIENIADGPKDDPKDGPKELTDRQKNIIDLISSNQSVTRDELAQRLNVSDTTIKRELSTLREKGVIGREGGKTHGRWVIKTNHTFHIR